MDEQDIIVQSQRLHFRKSLLDPSDSVLHISNRDGEDFLQKWHTTLSISDDEEYSIPTFSWHNEISFAISNSFSVLNILGSKVYHTFVQYFFFDLSFSSFLLVYLVSMSFDSSAVWSGEICSDCSVRDIGNVSVIPLYAFWGVFRRLVIHQVFSDTFLQCWMFCNGIATSSLVVLPHIRFVLCVCCIVYTLLSSLLLQFIRYRTLSDSDTVCDFYLCVFLSNEGVDFVSVEMS